MCKKPCPSCPYLKKSIPGYFGGNDKEHFQRAIHGELVLPCHSRSKTDKNHEFISSKVVGCRGQVIAQINSCKIPINPVLLKIRKELEASDDFKQLKENNLSAFNFDKHHSKLDELL